MNPIIIYRGSSGLNTVVDPTRILINRAGVNDIAEAVNITIDSTGRVSRREGFVNVVSGTGFHSLFCDGGDCFIARSFHNDGDAIYRVVNHGENSFTLQGIRSGMTQQARISWCQVGDETYYCNGFERGIIKDGVSRVWFLGDYHGVDTTIRFDIPEGMKHIAAFAGRMFASAGNVLWWSEPYRYDLFPMAENFAQFNTNIRLLKPVAGGLYVGTERNTYFIIGLLPNEFQLNKIASFPPIEWTDAVDYVDGSEIGLQVQGLCALWASIEGAILGTPTGQIINLNKSKIVYPESVTKGFGGLMGYHFLHGME
jgi:hypothetical protein